MADDHLGVGWRRVLDRVDGLVQQLQASSPTGRVTLIGHSSGGVMLRLYLSDEPVLRRGYGGASRCDRLVTLGSLHQAVRATLALDGGSTFWRHERVDYVAVAGEINLEGDNRLHSAGALRWQLQSIAGDGELSGDGYSCCFGTFGGCTTAGSGGHRARWFLRQGLVRLCATARVLVVFRDQ